MNAFQWWDFRLQLSRNFNLQYMPNFQFKNVFQFQSGRTIQNLNNLCWFHLIRHLSMQSIVFHKITKIKIQIIKTTQNVICLHGFGHPCSLSPCFWASCPSGHLVRNPEVEVQFNFASPITLTFINVLCFAVGDFGSCSLFKFEHFESKNCSLKEKKRR